MAPKKLSETFAVLSLLSLAMSGAVRFDLPDILIHPGQSAKTRLREQALDVCSKASKEQAPSIVAQTPGPVGADCYLVARQMLKDQRKTGKDNALSLLFLFTLLSGGLAVSYRAKEISDSIKQWNAERADHNSPSSDLG